MKFEEMHWHFEEQKVQAIFGETFILALSSPAVFRLQNRVSVFFNLLRWETKGFFQFHEHSKRFSKYLS